MRLLSDAELKTAGQAIDLAELAAYTLAGQAYKRSQWIGFAWGFFWATVFWATVFSLLWGIVGPSLVSCWICLAGF